MKKEARKIKKAISRERKYFGKVIKMNDTLKISNLTAYQKICRIVGVGLVDFDTAKRMIEEEMFCIPADYDAHTNRMIKLYFRFLPFRNKMKRRTKQ